MKPETTARFLVVLVIALSVGLPVLFWDRLSGADGAIEIHARMPENGGWSPETIQGKVGEALHLRMTSEDVIHGFAIGQMDIDEVLIVPGKWAETSLVFDRPGRYIYYCTRWCGANHWRMRGVIEVSGPGATVTPPPKPLFIDLGIDIDAPHLAEQAPVNMASADRGQALAEQMGSRIPGYLGDRMVYKSTSPEGLFLRLRTEDSLAGLSSDDLWDLVAYAWAKQTTPERLENGAGLYSKNCAACHGETGEGDGVMVEGAPAYDHTQAMEDDQPGDFGDLVRPPDFSDPHVLLGASPALLEGKMIRGGMGTGMPYWGPVFTEEQIDDLVAYLYTFAMDTRSR